MLGQAEWLQFVAILLNEEAKANAILAAIKHRYTSLSARVRAQAVTPTVVWLDPAQQRNKWVVPKERRKLARRKAHRAELPTALVVCEGSCTEAYYLRGLADHRRINRANLGIEIAGY